MATKGNEAQEEEPVPSGRTGVPSRIERLRERYLNEPRRICGERARLVTESYKQTETEHPYLRRAFALKNVLAKQTVVIREDELIVGNKTKYLRGCPVCPEWSATWLTKELDQFDAREESNVSVSQQEEQSISEDLKYWLGRTVQDKTIALWRETLGSKVEDAIDAGLIMDISWESHGRVLPDYAKVLNIGLKGIIAEAQEQLAKIKTLSLANIEKKLFLQGVIISCEGVISFARRHATLAREMAKYETDIERRKELERIAGVCEWVPENPGRTFSEALQSFWFVHLAIHIENDPNGLSPGRFDQYMYPFYKYDIRAGTLSREDAKELLECLWVKMTEVERLFPNWATRAYNSRYQNIAIGGPNPDGSDSTNDLSYLILEAVAEAGVIQPTISIRYHDGAPEEFLSKAAEVVRSGIGMPAFFNSKAIIPKLQKHGLTIEEARDWAVAGCVHMYPSHIAPNEVGVGFVNVAKCLELALNNGVDPKSATRVGLRTGDPDKFASFDELWNAFRRQYADAVKLGCVSGNAQLVVHAKHTPLVFQSALIDDCIKKGRDADNGGAKYNNLISVVHMGIVDAANSLAAVKKSVFDDRSLSMRDVLAACNNNFDGHYDAQRILQGAPKYGNDDQYVDKLVADIFSLAKETVSRHKNIYGKPYVLATLSIVAHYHFGVHTGALPSGRKAYVPLTDGTLSPTPGTDTRGPTAVINSAASCTQLVGRDTLSTLLNQKFHPSALQGKDALKKLLALIKTYFDSFGNHIQFNVVSRDTLLAAQRNPSKYRNLIVRVAGFSTYFVDLPKAVQDEIIARTEQMF